MSVDLKAIRARIAAATPGPWECGGRWRHRPIWDAHAIEPELLDEILAFVREHRSRRSVVIQCQVGLSRSASVAAALAYVLDGIAWDEAERRVLVEEHPTFPRTLTLASAKVWAMRTKRVARG